VIIYVAGKYSGIDYEQIEDNILISQKYSVDIWNMGHQAFSPHLNTRHFEKICKAGYDDYLDFDLKILRMCDALFMLPDWEQSKGATKEHAYAKQLGIPIYYKLEDIPKGRSEGLEQLLKYYDEFCALERQRIITSHKKYGNDWKTKDSIKEIFYELLDVLGYAALDHAKKRYIEDNATPNP